MMENTKQSHAHTGTFLSKIVSSLHHTFIRVGRASTSLWVRHAAGFLGLQYTGVEASPRPLLPPRWWEASPEADLYAIWVSK